MNLPIVNVLLYRQWENVIHSGAVTVIGLVHSMGVFDEDSW